MTAVWHNASDTSYVLNMLNWSLYNKSYARSPRSVGVHIYSCWKMNARITRNICTSLLALKMEVFWDVKQCWPLNSQASFEGTMLLWRSLSLKQFTQCKIPEDLDLHQHYWQNLKSVSVLFTYFCFTPTVLQIPPK